MKVHSETKARSGRSASPPVFLGTISRRVELRPRRGSGGAGGPRDVLDPRHELDAAVLLREAHDGERCTAAAISSRARARRFAAGWRSTRRFDIKLRQVNPPGAGPVPFFSRLRAVGERGKKRFVRRSLGTRAASKHVSYGPAFEQAAAGDFGARNGSIRPGRRDRRTLGRGRRSTERKRGLGSDLVGSTGPGGARADDGHDSGRSPVRSLDRSRFREASDTPSRGTPAARPAPDRVQLSAKGTLACERRNGRQSAVRISLSIECTVVAWTVGVDSRSRLHRPNPAPARGTLTCVTLHWRPRTAWQAGSSQRGRSRARRPRSWPTPTLGLEGKVARGGRAS